MFLNITGGSGEGWHPWFLYPAGGWGIAVALNFAGSITGKRRKSISSRFKNKVKMGTYNTLIKFVNNDNKENINVSYTSSLYPTPTKYSSRYGHAAAALLRTVTMTPENQYMWAILDSGASSTFLLSRAPVHNAQVAANPLNIKLPNGTTIQSSHIAELALPQLPKQARLAHIVPGLASHSLVSVVKLCNAGCKVVIDDISCEIQYRGAPVIKCSKCTRTGLWMLPLTETANQSAEVSSQSQNDVTEQAYHVHQSSTKAETAQFYHHSAKPKKSLISM